MASTFAGLAIAARGLYASQTGLLVTGNNISNVNTAGYSRQVVNQSAASPAAVYAGKGVIGGGVQVNAVDRVRNIRLDEKYWQENTDLGEWQTKADAL
ncbi:MAG TPA: flagellar hook-associated protein FlgK, partial [Firmicutes bacterium]|nr:flagellar hook-associated protein FlgK [Bacillota bacterium]